MVQTQIVAPASYMIFRDLNKSVRCTRIDICENSFLSMNGIEHILVCVADEERSLFIYLRHDFGV